MGLFYMVGWSTDKQWITSQHQKLWNIIFRVNMWVLENKTQFWQLQSCKFSSESPTDYQCDVTMASYTLHSPHSTALFRCYCHVLHLWCGIPHTAHVEVMEQKMNLWQWNWHISGIELVFWAPPFFGPTEIVICQLYCNLLSLRSQFPIMKVAKVLLSALREGVETESCN